MWKCLLTPGRSYSSKLDGEKVTRYLWISSKHFLTCNQNGITSRNGVEKCTHILPFSYSILLNAYFSFISSKSFSLVSIKLNFVFEQGFL